LGGAGYAGAQKQAFASAPSAAYSIQCCFLTQGQHLTLQGFIQRAGPEILLRELPPKHELLLALVPTQLQQQFLQDLVCLATVKGKMLLRDMAVGDAVSEQQQVLRIILNPPLLSCILLLSYILLYFLV
jgi:hypothetical protein